MAEIVTRPNHNNGTANLTGQVRNTASNVYAYLGIIPVNSSTGGTSYSDYVRTSPTGVLGTAASTVTASRAVNSGLANGVQYMAVAFSSFQSSNPTTIAAASLSANRHSVGYYSSTAKTISFNANGGSGAPSSITSYWATSSALTTVFVNIPSTTPTRAGYTFLGWSTSSTATSASFAVGATEAEVPVGTLYAVWKYNQPALVKVSGAWKTAKGVYVKVSGAWKIATAIYVKVNGTWKKQTS